MTSKTNFINYFLLAFTLAFISSGLSAGTLDFKDKKKDKEKKEELTADGPYVLYQPDGQIRVINVDKKGNIIDTTYTTLPQNFTLHVTDHKGRFPFDVKLHPVKPSRMELSPGRQSFCHVRPSWKAGLCNQPVTRQSYH